MVFLPSLVNHFLCKKTKTKIVRPTIRTGNPAAIPIREILARAIKRKTLVSNLRTGINNSNRRTAISSNNKAESRTNNKAKSNSNNRRGKNNSSSLKTAINSSNKAEMAAVVVLAVIAATSTLLRCNK